MVTEQHATRYPKQRRQERHLFSAPPLSEKKDYNGKNGLYISLKSLFSRYIQWYDECNLVRDQWEERGDVCENVLKSPGNQWHAEFNKDCMIYDVKHQIR